MLFFELELVKLQKGVPEGYMFVWLGDGPDPLFPAMDLNGDKKVPLEEARDASWPNQLVYFCYLHNLYYSESSSASAVFVLHHASSQGGQRSSPAGDRR